MFNKKNFFNKRILNKQSINSLIKLIQKNSDNNIIKIFNLLNIYKAISVFKLLDFDIKKKIIEKLSSDKKKEFLNKLSVDNRISFLEKLPYIFLKDLIKYLNPKEKKKTLVSLGYPENSVGRLIIPYNISVKENWIIKNVLNYIRKEIKNFDVVEIIYVIDKRGKLIDNIKIGKFLLVSPNTKVLKLMDRENIDFLRATDTEEVAIKKFSINNRVSLPVVDDKNYLLGIVTVDDILYVLNKNYKKNFKKIGSIEYLNKSYFNISLYKLIIKRARWLIFLFVGELLTTTVMQNFSNWIEKAVVLSLFIPLVVSSGGNSGSQASSLIIQAMALGEVKIKDWYRVMKREIICGFFLGIILGFTGFIRIIIWQNFNLFDYGIYWIKIGITVFFSLIGIVLWGTLSGGMLPFVIKKLGGDPASSSAPFVATLVDVVGLIIYFFIAYIILHGILL